MNAWNRNRVTEKLGINYPIVQGPLGGLSSQKLTAAVSNFGGLGSFGALNLSPEEIKNYFSSSFTDIEALRGELVGVDGR